MNTRDTICLSLNDPGYRETIEEIQGIILDHFPGTTFDVYLGEEPLGVYVEALVEVDDIDDVMDIYIDRLVDLKVERGLRLYVLPVSTSEHDARRPQHQDDVVVLPTS